MSSRVGGALVAVVVLVVLVATIAMWVDFRHEVDRTVARAAQAAPSDPPSPSAAPTMAPAPVRSQWIGDGYTATACGAARQLGWECTVDAEQATGFLSDGTSFDPDFQVLG